MRLSNLAEAALWAGLAVVLLMLFTSPAHSATVIQEPAKPVAVCHARLLHKEGDQLTFQYECDQAFRMYLYTTDSHEVYKGLASSDHAAKGEVTVTLDEFNQGIMALRIQRQH